MFNARFNLKSLFNVKTGFQDINVGSFYTSQIILLYGVFVHFHFLQSYTFKIFINAKKFMENLFIFILQDIHTLIYTFG